MIRTHIPARPRNKKIVPTGGSSIAPIVSSGGSSHSHNNKPVIDQLTQGNIDVLSYLSLHQTGVEMEPELDEYGQPVLDVNGNPVMVPVEVPVLDDLGQPVLDINGDPVTEQIPVYAIKSTATFFSEKEVSAYGLGDEGSGGGGGFYMLLSWTNYSAETEQWVISAALAKDMLDRIVVLEAGSGGGGSTVTWGTESGGYIPLTVEGVSKSVALSNHTHSEYALSNHTHSGYALSNHTHSEYALSNHTHSGVYEPIFSKNTAFNKDFGTTSGTVAEGNDSRIVNGQTAYSWGDHAAAGYALATHNHSGVYEPIFSKNTAFNKDFGTTSGTVAEGNDSRIVNGQTAYGWGDHAVAGYSLTTHNHSGVYEPVFSKNTAFNKNFGTTATTVARGNHTHSGVYEPIFSKNTAFNKDFGTTSGTVAEGNDSRIVNGQTAYSWGDHAAAGYALATHNHSGVYEPIFSKNTAFNKNFGTEYGTVARGNHAHSGVYEPAFTKNTAFNKDFGTTSGTVAEGNDSRIENGQTAYGWGNHASAGYALSSELSDYVTLATAQTISGAKTFSSNLTASASVTTPKVIFAAAGWSLEQTGTELQMKYNGTAKMRFLSGGSIVATQEITAYS